MYWAPSLERVPRGPRVEVVDAREALRVGQRRGDGRRHRRRDAERAHGRVGGRGDGDGLDGVGDVVGRRPRRGRHVAELRPLERVVEHEALGVRRPHGRRDGRRRRAQRRAVGHGEHQSAARVDLERRRGQLGIRQGHLAVAQRDGLGRVALAVDGHDELAEGEDRLVGQGHGHDAALLAPDGPRAAVVADLRLALGEDGVARDLDDLDERLEVLRARPRRVDEVLGVVERDDEVRARRRTLRGRHGRRGRVLVLVLGEAHGDVARDEEGPEHGHLRHGCCLAASKGCRWEEVFFSRFRGAGARPAGFFRARGASGPGAKASGSRRREGVRRARRARADTTRMRACQPSIRPR
mmetsp:Transcript_4271/g.14609  ORF Transcript_4271/g.14609 Transcript_4271/m.14609 type:complete len:353 (+) Transcript_4271:1375-2433(+)